VRNLGGTASPVTVAWDEQSVWSQAANRLHTAIGRARVTALALGIASAVLGTAASQVMNRNGPLGQSLAFGAALAAGLVPTLSARFGRSVIADWTRLRSVSESLKSEVYVYLAGVGPYRTGRPDTLLLRRVEDLRAEASDLLPHTTGLTARSRTPPAVNGVDSYVELRVRRQIDGYYRPGAARMGRNLARVRRTELLLGILGAALGALSGAFGVEQAAAWVAVTTTVGTAVSVHALACKYQYQQSEFARTADELQHLLNRQAAEGTACGPAVEDDFVARCEHVMSTLHDAWVVKWTTE
jgi:hypothetical protein